MDLDIRKAVFNNLNKASKDEIAATITDAIATKEEKTLPGLGVLFELLWKNSGAEWRDECLHKLSLYLD